MALYIKIAEFIKSKFGNPYFFRPKSRISGDSSLQFVPIANLIFKSKLILSKKHSYKSKT